MSSEFPAILVVHGGYFLPPSWEPLVTTLTSAGFRVHIPRLPTCGDSRPPTATLESDVSAVQSELKKLSANGHEVIVLAHSYGGIVASEALTAEYIKVVKRIILISAWLICPGDSVQDVMGKHGFPTEVDLAMNEDGTAYAKNPAHCFFNDINEWDSSRAEELGKANVTHNIFVVGGKIQGSPWKERRTIYVYCKDDKSIGLSLQEAMVKDAKDQGGQIETFTMEGGHCPFLSRPEEVLNVIKTAAGPAP